MREVMCGGLYPDTHTQNLGIGGKKEKIWNCRQNQKNMFLGAKPEKYVFGRISRKICFPPRNRKKMFLAGFPEKYVFGDRIGKICFRAGNQKNMFLGAKSKKFVFSIGISYMASSGRILATPDTQKDSDPGTNQKVRVLKKEGHVIPFPNYGARTDGLICVYGPHPRIQLKTCIFRKAAWHVAIKEETKGRIEG